MKPSIAAQIETARKNLKECLDNWVQLEASLTRMEAEMKHWPRAANLKKTLNGKS